jgi:CheY-like chemotaxis protein
MSAVNVHCFPSVDLAFAAEVTELLGASQSSHLRDPGALQGALRAMHPNAIVSVRDQLGGRGDEARPLWYVFRDGGLAARPSAPRRVLVLDDDESFAEMLEAMLVQAGFEVRRARDGMEGLDLATEFLPNLILLDLAMPRASGEDFADGYRRMPDPKAQIVVISGRPDAWKRAQATDARAFFRKPFEMDEFLKVVRHLA